MWNYLKSFMCAELNRQLVRTLWSMHPRLRNPICIRERGGGVEVGTGTGTGLKQCYTYTIKPIIMILVIYYLNFNSQKTGGNLYVITSSCGVTKLSQIYAIFQQNWPGILFFVKLSQTKMTTLLLKFLQLHQLLSANYHKIPHFIVTINKIHLFHPVL